MVWRRPLSKQAGPGPEDPVTQERQIAAVIESTLIAVADRIPASVLETQDADRILAAVPWLEVGEDLMAVSPPLQTVIKRAAVEEIPRGALQKAEVPDLAALPIELAMVNELAVNYADQHAGRLVVEISAGMRKTINEVTTSTVAGQLPRGVMTKVIRETIPLHSAWATAVQKAAARTYQRELADGASESAAAMKAGKVAENRANALTRRRAQNIARTEAMTAQNEGKLASWHQQVANGWVQPDSMKEWVEGRNPCARCAPLVGELVPWDQPFSNGQQMPPEHPSCRCTAALLPPDDPSLEEKRLAHDRAQSGSSVKTLSYDPDFETDMGPFRDVQADQIKAGDWRYIKDRAQRATVLLQNDYRVEQAVKGAARNIDAGRPAFDKMDVLAPKFEGWRKGYEGIPRDFKFTDGAPTFVADDVNAAVEDAARWLLDQDTVDAPVLYKGLEIDPAEMSRYTPGTEFNVSFSSFSADPSVARRYTGSGQKVIVRVRNAKAVPLNDSDNPSMFAGIGDPHREYLVSGRGTLEAVTVEGDVTWFDVAV